MLSHGEARGNGADSSAAPRPVDISLLSSIIAIATSSLDAEHVAEQSVAAIHAHFSTLTVALSLANRERTRLRVAAMRGIPDGYLGESGIIPVDADHVVAEVFRSGTPFHGQDITAHPHGSPLARSLHAQGVIPGSYHILPLKGRASTVGVLTLTWSREGPLDPHEGTSLSSLADILATGVENAYLYEDERGSAEIARRLSTASQALAMEFSGIFEALTEAVVVFDGPGSIVRANPAAVELFGFDPVECRPGTFLERAGICDPDGVAMQPPGMPCRHALDGRTVSDVPLIVNHSGTRKRVLVSASPISRDEGPVAAVSVWRDVTERESLLETLARERTRVEDILASITDGFAVLDRDGVFLSVNASFAQMFGVESADTIGRHLLDVFPTTLGSRVEIAVHEAILEESPSAFVQHYAPTELWAEMRVYPAPDGATVFVSDGSARRQAEQERELLLGAYQTELARTSLLKDIAATAGSSLSTRQVCHRVMHTIRAHLDPRQCLLHRYEESADALLLSAHFGLPAYTVSSLERMRADSSSAPGHLIISDALYITHESRDEIAWPDPERNGAARWIVVPVNSTGTLLGTLGVAFEGRRPFTDDEISLFRSVAAQISAALDNARLYQREHRIADTLQRSLLAETVRIRGIETGRVYRSATEHLRVGGDFYDIYPLPDGRAVIAVGDVSGKGLRAASVTALVRNTLRAYALDRLQPHEAIGRVNEVLCYFSDREVFSTAVYGILDPVGGSLQYCNGGHPAPMILRMSGEVTVLDTSGPMLGAMEGLQYRTGSTRLDPGEVLVLYTDGVTEARHGNEFYGEERVAEILGSMEGAPAETIARSIADSAARFGGGVLRDDVAVVALRVTPQGSLT